MATNAANVRSTVTGAIYFANNGNNLPETATESLHVSYTDLGYVSSDGIESTLDKSTNAVYAMQNADKVLERVTEAGHTMSFTLLETTKEVIEVYFGSTMVNGKIEIVPSSTTKGSFVIDIIDGDKAIRYVIPSAEVLSVEPQTFANGEPVSYGMTITAFPVDGRTADVIYAEFEDES
jgi:hypothetical protein